MMMMNVESGMRNDVWNLNRCTNTNWNGCAHKATAENILRPIRSARLHTDGSFAFKYGVLEVRAKMPAGDWLWPGKCIWTTFDSLQTPLSTEKTALTLNAYCMHLTAIWLLPQDRVYGDWPRSGEIDLLESRGNRKYVDHNNEHIGVENFGSTLHFGPRWDQDGWSTATMNKRTPAGQGYDRQFHNYKLEWTPTYIRVFLDNNHVGEISVDDGFWKRGNFQGENIWPNDSPMAPFDKEVFSYWFFFFVVRCTLKMKWFVVCSFSSSWIWPLVERMDTSQTRATMAASHGLILNHLPILPTGMASNNGWIRGIWWAVTRHWSLIRSKFGLFNFESVLDVIELAICLPIQQ